jgi:putative hydrolase of the HAD superfamily
MRAILFDLDGTLFDRESAIRDLLGQQYRRFSADLAEVPEDAYVARLLELDAHGYGEKTAAYRRLAEGFALGDRLAATLVADFWATYHSCCRGFPEVPAILVELRRRGFRLGIVTNGSVSIQEPVVDRLKLRSLLDTVLISEREGVRKPDREIFDRAVRAIGVRSADACFVGDHPDTDVAGAAAAGLLAIWRRTAHWPQPTVSHFAIDSLEELVASDGILARGPV